MSKSYKDILIESHKEGTTYIGTHHSNHDPVDMDTSLARLKRQVLHGIKIEKYHFDPNDKIKGVAALAQAIKDAPDEYSVEDLISTYTRSEVDTIETVDESCDSVEECGDCSCDSKGKGKKVVFADDADVIDAEEDLTDDYDEDGRVEGDGKKAAKEIGEGVDPNKYDSNGKIDEETQDPAELMEAELSPLQQLYRDFFKGKLAMFKANSPAQLNDEQKVEFFNQIKAEWKKERAASGLKPKQSVKEDVLNEDGGLSVLIAPLISAGIILTYQFYYQHKYKKDHCGHLKGIAKDICVKKAYKKDAEAALKSCESQMHKFKDDPKKTKQLKGLMIDLKKEIKKYETELNQLKRQLS